jgi:hypothetical protein
MRAIDTVIKEFPIKKMLLRFTALFATSTFICVFLSDAQKEQVAHISSLIAMIASILCAYFFAFKARQLSNITRAAISGYCFGISICYCLYLGFKITPSNLYYYLSIHSQTASFFNAGTIGLFVALLLIYIEKINK